MMNPLCRSFFLHRRHCVAPEESRATVVEGPWVSRPTLVFIAFFVAMLVISAICVIVLRAIGSDLGPLK